MPAGYEPWPIVRALAWIRWRDDEVAAYLGTEGPSAYTAARFYPDFPISVPSGPRVCKKLEAGEQDCLLEALRCGQLGAFLVDPATGQSDDVDARTWLVWAISPSGEVVSRKKGPLREIYFDGYAVRKKWPSIGRDLEAELIVWLEEFFNKNNPSHSDTKASIREQAYPKVGTRVFGRAWATATRNHQAWSKPGPRPKDQNAIRNTDRKSGH